LRPRVAVRQSSEIYHTMMGSARTGRDRVAAIIIVLVTAYGV
jgi:hypothetical protein